MAALAERRIIPHDELKARAEEKEAEAVRPEHLRLLEALLFAAAAPLDEKTLAARLPEDVDVKASLRALQRIGSQPARSALTELSTTGDFFLKRQAARVAKEPA